MSKRFFNPSVNCVCLLLTIGAILLSANVGFSADTYAVPQTAEVTLAWDPNDPIPEGYRIFQRTEGQAYDYGQPCWTGSDTEGSIYNLDWDTTYYFVVRAYDGDLESADSEEVSYHTPVAETATHALKAASGGNGSITPNGVVNIVEGADQSFTITPENGYHISDVLVDGVSQGAIASYTFSQIVADHTIEALFAANTYTISAAAGDNGNISPVGDSQITHGGSLTYTVTPDTGYHIANVLVDGVAQGVVASYTFADVAQDHTITVSFAVDTFSIAASVEANGSITPAGIVAVNFGASQTFALAPDPGYHVANVLVDGASQGVVSSYTFNQIAASHSISASFALNTYTINASAGANGSISPAGIVSAANGSSQTYAITPDAGYHIADVIVDGKPVGAVSSYTFNTITSDHSIHAVFATDTFTVTATAAEGGSIVPSGSIAVNRGESLAFSITADEGYEIEDLFVDGVSQGAQDSYTLDNITAECTLAAVFHPLNQAPVADAGPDQKVDEGQAVTLNGFNSTDADDGIAEFQWYQIQGDEVALIGADQGQARFTAPDVDESGVSLVFELHVTDYAGETTVDTCIVNVTWVNEPPAADAGQAQTVNEGDVVTLSGTGSTDPDDGIDQYVWTQTQGPAVTLSGSASAVASFTAPNTDAEGASLAFQLTVTDAGGLQDTAACLVSVAWVNTPPQADAGEDQQVSSGDDVTLNGTRSTDTDGDTDLSYRWRQTEGTPVELSDATAIQPGFVAPEIEEEMQTLTFELTVTDSQGLQDLDTCHVVVMGSTEEEADTTAPVLTVTSPYRDSVTTSRFYIGMSGSASDDTGVAKVAWKNDRGGSGVASGTEQWTIYPIRLSYGTNVITLTATDAAGNATSVTRTVIFQSRWWWWW